MQTSEQINEIASALSRAQHTMRVAAFDSKNPHFKSNYASFTSVVAAVREPLTSNGIAFIQSVVTLPTGLMVVTRLMHSSGQWIETDGPMIPVAKNDAHGAMSASTYAKRGSLSVALSLPADDDDDGNAAVAASKQAAAAPSLMTELLARISSAKDAVALGEVGASLSSIEVDEASKKKLREAFSSRRKALEAA